MSRPDIRQQMIDSWRNRCKHFTGIAHDTCKAGVNYRALVGGPDAGWAIRLPCNPSLRKAESAPVPCECRELNTDAELEQRADNHLRRMDNFAIAHKAAKDDARGKGFKKGKPGGGSLSCPICKIGTLRYSVAGLNGHMHAGCSTPNCVSWME